MIAIEVENNVPIPRCEPRIPHNVQKAMDNYREAYKVVYGIPASVTFDGEYVRVMGQKAGFKLGALRRATRQLIYRAG